MKQAATNTAVARNSGSRIFVTVLHDTIAVLRYVPSIIFWKIVFFWTTGLLNPFRAPKPLSILNPSDFVPKNGFPVVKASTWNRRKLSFLFINSMWTQWVCGGSAVHAKRCRGGTEVSAKITCDKKEQRVVWKGCLRRKREGKGKIPERERESVRGEKGETKESDHGGLDRHLIITEQCP